MNIFTIGYTGTTARCFFNRLRNAGVRKIVDVRLNNVSQLAGFAKKDDLEFFLEAILQIGYEHIPDLAPTQELLTDYRKRRVDWPGYAARFIELMKDRAVENLDRERFNEACLLCSEDLAHKCHRRLVAEYLRHKWGDVNILHL